ncbi:MAG: methyltransferase domain-containing protein [Chlamydiales bacterium]|nr:methyltransferase domain-containing protein [Chlamydiales bacterium]
MKKKLLLLVFLFSLLFSVLLRSNIVDPKLYNNASIQQFELASQAFNYLSLKSNEIILDVGCGDGKITVEVAKLVPHGTVHGLDASKEMIRYAKKNYNNQANLSFYNGKAEDISDKNKYDYIISFSAMLWFDDQEKAFNNMVNALKPNGKLIIITPPKESCDWVYYEKALDDPRWNAFKSRSAYNKMLSIDDYKELILKNHLTIIKFQNEKHFYTQKNLEDFKEYVKSWFFCYLILPESLLDQYLEVLAQCAKEYFLPNNDGAFAIPYDALTMVLQKDTVTSA